MRHTHTHSQTRTHVPGSYAISNLVGPPQSLEFSNTHRHTHIIIISSGVRLDKSVPGSVLNEYVYEGIHEDKAMKLHVI